MHGAPQPSAQPKVPDPIRIPSPDDPDLIAARQKKLQDAMAQKGGRASTEISTDKGPAYSRTTLG